MAEELVRIVGRWDGVDVTIKCVHANLLRAGLGGVMLIVAMVFSHLTLDENWAKIQSRRLA